MPFGGRDAEAVQKRVEVLEAELRVYELAHLVHLCAEALGQVPDRQPLFPEYLVHLDEALEPVG
jgi:hypothetical protein